MNAHALLRFSLPALFVSLVACGTSDSSPTTTGGGGNGSGGSGAGGSDPNAQFKACKKETVEPDFKTLQPLSGPGVDMTSGKVKPGKYIVATTYLAANPNEVKRTFSLSMPIIGSLPSMKGFVAASFGQSNACATLRTLTVWESEEDLMTFIMSPAHAAAMKQIGTISRGTSNTTDWESKGDDATFADAAKKLGSDKSSDI
jgi:heme-degrading monooxygenase HmoA